MVELFAGYCPDCGNLPIEDNLVILFFERRYPAFLDVLEILLY